MIRPASLLALTLLLFTTGCTSTGGRYPAHRPNNSYYRPNQGYATQLPGPVPARYFDLGVNRGRSDWRRGLSHNPGRYYREVPVPARGEFSTGYNRGYRQGGRNQSRQWSSNPQRPSYGYSTHY